MASAVAILRKARIPFKLIGETSNLIFKDEQDYLCLVSTLRLDGIHYDTTTQLLVADAGALLPELSRVALYHGFAGFAGLEGIPGTIGGAVFMNAAAYGYSISDILESIDLLCEDGSLVTMSASELELGYRTSVFREGKNRGIIIRARFYARPGDKESISREMELFHAKRHKYSEYLYPNVGSVFAGSIYRELATRDLFYRLVAACYMFFNYKCKVFRRESPINRRWINDFTVKRFGIRFTNQPFSDKTMNTLINNGHHTAEHLDYIEQIRRLTGDKIPVENEIVESF